MFETLQEKTEEKAMVQFLERFTDYPFLVKFKNSEYHIGEGEPTFTVNFKKAIPLADLMKSTSLALGEAYMRGDLDIEGNLYEALDHFLGQMGKFSTNESALKKIMFSSTSKKNQEKEVTSHYDIGNDFYKLWLDETMSYSCGYFIHEDDTLYQALQVFISVTHLWVPRIRESYSISDSFFFYKKISWMLPTSRTIKSTTNTLT